MKEEDIENGVNVCCVIADSLRWDVFAESNPVNILNLDRVKKVYSFACCTLPSVTSYLMNYPPMQEGSGFFHEGRWDELSEGDTIIARKHRAVRKWMPRYYQERGYTTIWESSNPVPLRLDGELDGAISRYFRYWRSPQYQSLGDITTPYVIKDLDALVMKHHDDPIFSVTLLMDTHSPYHDGDGHAWLLDTGQPDINKHRQMLAMRYIDIIFPNFLEIFRKTGRPTEFIFTSDHGEKFGGPGGWGHSPFRRDMRFNQELFAIPWLRKRIDDWSKIKITRGGADE
ncbi:LTA synthase family protein [Patescibacteria group bacterium]|uniref:Putative sulfatase n=2 Tax=viral metagenome TaxID=1070528 RepID=A0A6M3LWD4_9ZZZZ|nr:LTA synthase family protein [Patescibacteria group bacterium]